MENNFQKVLQGLLDNEAKKSVFASFSNLRDIPKFSLSLTAPDKVVPYEAAIKKLQNNPFFREARDANMDMRVFKEMAMRSMKKAYEELESKLSFVFDNA